MLIILGVLIVLSPWSGLPHSWMQVLLVVLGLGVAAIAVTLRNRTAAPVLANVPADAEAHVVRPYIS